MEVNIDFLFVSDDWIQNFKPKRNKKKMSLSTQHPGKDSIVIIIEKSTTPEED